jgi:hypothetical protein
MKKFTYGAFIAGMVLGLVLSGTVLAAKPGDADDPLVSLSYLRSGTAFHTVTLGPGDKFSVAPGEEFILVDGDMHLDGNASFTVVDISRGKMFKDPKFVEANHLVIFVGNSSVDVVAGRKAICLVRGTTLD